MATTWSELKKTKKYPPLRNNISADVVIIGGGITGILNAYMLSRAGKKVVLLEEGELASSATMATTAFITKVIDTELSEVSSLFGIDAAKKVWQSGQEAVEEFEDIINAEGIECEFMRCPNYIFAGSGRQRETLLEEYKSYRHFGIEASLGKNGNKLGFGTHGYIEVPNQAKFHVTKFLYALAEKTRQAGAKIYEQTKADDIWEENGKILVQTKKGDMITAQDAIIATYKPIINKKTHLKKAMYVSYILEVKIPKGSFPEATYEDLSNPYYYFRVDREASDGKYDRLILGGEDHKDIFGKTLVKESFEGLQKFLKKLMDGRPYTIVKKWRGPILEPSDGLPLIGEISPHIYVATAFSGNGMTYSMISSLILRDLIFSEDNPWAETYSPRRTLLHPKRLAYKARDYVEEFFGGALKNLLS